MKSCPEIKICGITKRKDAEVATDLGSSYLGFILYPKSPRFLPAKEAKGIISSLSAPRPYSVAVDVNPNISELEAAKVFSFDFYQLHFPLSTPFDLIKQWSSLVGCSKLWLAPQIEPGRTFPEDILPLADTFLVDAYSKDKFGGTGHKADWALFENLKNQYPHKKWVLAGGLGPHNLNEALLQANPDVLDMNSALEIDPGVKDHNKLHLAFSLLPT